MKLQSSASVARVYGDMADDGMLLNFEAPTDIFSAPQQKFKGGTWRDRLAAKRASQNPRARNAIPDYRLQDSRTEELIHPDVPPRKRPRHEPSSTDRVPVTGDRQVISSLFTYNRPAVSSRSDEAVSDEPVQPSNAPLDDGLASFTTLGLAPTIANHLLKKMDIAAPTAIQKKSIQHLCAGDTDAFIQAQTGSGKTLAYLLPIVQKLSALSKQMKTAGQDFSRDSGLFAIILTPTRELSKQINTVLENLLLCYNWIVAGTVIGGEKKKSEKGRLRKGLNILVATPGRLADHLDHTEVLDVSKVRWLVLDEGDRLMELGFEKDIQKIISVLNIRGRSAQETKIDGLPSKRTTVLCSATLKTDVEQLKKIALKDPISLSAEDDGVGSGNQSAQDKSDYSAPAQLRQSYIIVPPKQRLVSLIAMLKLAFKRKGSVTKCIVFFSCADSVDFHFEVLTRGDQRASEGESEKETSVPHNVKLSKTNHITQGNTISESRTQGLGTAFQGKENAVQMFRLHGSLQQAIRTKTLKNFTSSTQPSVLICTDVASRGLDVPDIDLVIEYDPPFSKDDHLHRIGRTARAGRDGRASIFLMPGCEEAYVDILKQSRARNLTRHDGDEILKKGFSATSGVVNASDWEQAATDFQLDIERWTLENPNHLEQARRAFQSHVRAYATHVAAERTIFDIKQLHLGHLAKAFALRDKPGSIRVPGLRPGNTNEHKGMRKRTGVNGSALGTPSTAKRSHGVDDDEVDTRVADERESRKKMMMKIKAMVGVSEFNLG